MKKWWPAEDCLTWLELSTGEAISCRRNVLVFYYLIFRQYLPPRKSIMIDFSTIDDSVYDIKPPLDISITEDNALV